MIFKFLKRSSPPAAPAKPKPSKPPRKAKGDTLPMVPEPSSLEVTEGSAHEDWALWENSVAELDSQLSSIQPGSRRFRHEPETPTDFQDVEAFARVKNKDP